LSNPAGAELKRTPLHALHKAAGARMAEFGGWNMPIEYSGIVQEHLAVRTAAGLFDVSHMGEIEIQGPEALALVQWVTSNDASRLKDNQAQYTALMYPQGCAVDDCIVHRFGPNHYFICVNAANADKDFAWITENNRFDAEARNVSADYAQIALQGPKAVEILAQLTSADLTALRTYWFRRARVCGLDGLLARTGYTGEDGFEFYFPPAEAKRVWNEFLESGKTAGLVPVGLGARNTLRLEAAYALYGHELDEQTTLFEANLGWIVKLDKGDFIGRQALADQQARGIRKKLVGFELTDRGIVRDGYEVKEGSQTIGRVTSGTHAPFLKKSIGMAFVPVERASVGSEIEIDIRGKSAKARQVLLPFYRRPKTQS
jgi:aminomethyltransferase